MTENKELERNDLVIDREMEVDDDNPHQINFYISAFVFVIHSYVTFELIFFSEYRVAILFDVIESAGITLTVFRNAFAEQRSFVVKKSETGNLFVKVSFNFSD